MEGAPDKSVPWILWLILLSVAVVVGTNVYRNTYLKQYQFIVEAKCDPKVSGTSHGAQRTAPG